MRVAAEAKESGAFLQVLFQPRMDLVVTSSKDEHYVPLLTGKKYTGLQTGTNFKHGLAQFADAQARMDVGFSHCFRREGDGVVDFSDLRVGEFLQ